MANIRQQIVDLIEARLAAIPAVKRVCVWRTNDLPPQELPAIIVRDTNDSMPPDGIGNGRRDHDLQVEIMALLPGSTGPSQAREMIASMVAAIGTDDKWSGLAYDTILRSADLDMDEMAQAVTTASIIITVRYRSGLWKL